MGESREVRLHALIVVRLVLFGCGFSNPETALPRSFTSRLALQSRSSTRTVMEAADLARWTRFAAKGGIGKCTAIVDCVAENADDLMFLKVRRLSVF